MNGGLTETILLYFFRLFCFAFLAFFYFCFRGAIDGRLIRQKKLSYIKLNKLKKGIKNYWFLESLHKKVNLRIWYKINRIFVISYLILLIPFYFLGYITAIGNLITFLSLFLYPFALIFYIFDTIEHNLEYYGRKYVILRKNPHKGNIDSVLIDLLGCCFIIMIFYAQISSLFS